MAINPPVDATQTPEWAALQKHYDELQVRGRQPQAVVRR